MKLAKKEECTAHTVRTLRGFLRIIILECFYLQKKLKLLEKDIGLDVNRIEWTLLQIRSDRSRIRIIFIRFRIRLFFSDSNRKILPRIELSLHRIRIIRSPLNT